MHYFHDSNYKEMGSSETGRFLGLFSGLKRLYLLLMFILMLRLKGVLHEQFAGPDASRFGMISWRLPSLLLVMSLPIVALLGLAGYLNLAWGDRLAPGHL